MQQPLAPGLPPPPPSSQQQLTTTALHLFTQRFPASPRKTVQHYLQDQLNHADSYAPAVVEALSPGRAAAPLQSTRYKRRLSSDDRAETALVLHSEDVDEGLGWAGGRKQARPSKEGEGKPSTKRATLVGALKPKLSLQPADASPATTASKPKAAGKREEVVAELEDGGSTDQSPVLVARVDQRQHGVEEKKSYAAVPRRDQSSSRKENFVVEVNRASTVASKGKGKAKERPADKSSDKKVTEQDAYLSDDQDEIAARLLARKERRRAKAVIVKNRNQSATAVGAAAAAKVKASHRSSKRLKGDNPDEPASDAESTSPKPKKKKRKASNEDINKDLQDVKKAKNVGASRLTLKPATKLGIFHNGQASTRVKVGRALPDLAFSELNFINGPRRSPTASTASERTTSLDPAPPKRTAKAQPHHAAVTYGTKAKKQRPSNYFEGAALSDSSSDAPAPPPPARKSSKTRPTKSQQQPPSPPRAPTPKKSRSKAKSKAPPPPSSSRAATESSALHSAYSIEQRKSASNSRQHHEDVEAQADPQDLDEAVLDTSTFWKRGRIAQPAEEQTGEAPSLHLDEPPSLPTTTTRPVHSPTRKRDPYYVLSSPISSAALERILEACQDQGGAVTDIASPTPGSFQQPYSTIADSDPRLSASAPSYEHMGAGSSVLGFSEQGGSSTDKLKREVGRGMRLGSDGMFRLAGSSAARGDYGGGSFDVGESEVGWRSSLLGERMEEGGGVSGWMEVDVGRDGTAEPMVLDDEGSFPFDQFASAIAEEDDDDAQEMPPPPPPATRSHDFNLGAFSSRFGVQEEDRLPTFGVGAMLGAREGRSSEEQSFRSAMTAHWYKSKC